MASRGRGARLKGSNFERHLAKLLTEATGTEFKRGLGQARMGGKEIADVYSDDAPWMHIEAKCQKVCSIKAAMQQALEDIDGGNETPIVITKDDHSEILVTLRFEDFVAFLTPMLKKKRV